MGIKAEDVEKWLQLGLSLAGGIPGAIGGLIAFIQTFSPPEIQQQWTPERIAAYLADYEFKQNQLNDEFNKRRKDEGEDEEDSDNDE